MWWGRGQSGVYIYHFAHIGIFTNYLGLSKHNTTCSIYLAINLTTRYPYIHLYYFLMSTKPSVKQNVIVVLALTCSGKSTLARIPDGNTPIHRNIQHKTYTGPTVGKFIGQGEKALYVQDKTEVRIFNDFEIFDLDPAPYRLRGATTTHDFDRYKADILKLNDISSSSSSSPPHKRIVFASTHEGTRHMLCDLGWRYWLVYPNKSLRAVWVNRLRVRDRDEPNREAVEKYIGFLNNNFDSFIDGMAKGLSIENKLAGCQSLTATSSTRSPSVAANGTVRQGEGEGEQTARVRWLEIRDGNMGVKEVLPFIIQQEGTQKTAAVLSQPKRQPSTPAVQQNQQNQQNQQSMQAGESRGLVPSRPKPTQAVPGNNTTVKRTKPALAQP